MVSSAVLIEPPTCWLASISAEPTPTSSWCTPAVAPWNAVLITPPRPRPSRTRPDRMPVADALSKASCASQAIPVAPARKLTLTTTFGPTLGSTSEGTVVAEARSR